MDVFHRAGIELQAQSIRGWFRLVARKSEWCSGEWRASIIIGRAICERVRRGVFDHSSLRSVVDRFGLRRM
ncbi:MAG TPA: hypothetical protein DHV59_07290 [Oxalobacteraceae bacterium]|nr:hypothetical protein [Oxalobacteraceae bacterium]